MNPNEPAYPVPEQHGQQRDSTGQWEQGWEPASLGLTKRELLAAMSMQGWYASMNMVNITDVHYGNISEHCVKSADALLAELSASEFCEWRTKLGCIVSDTTCGMETTLETNSERPFCPYCGKRIKEVA
jgi:hypothetical protein